MSKQIKTEWPPLLKGQKKSFRELVGQKEATSGFSLRVWVLSSLFQSVWEKFSFLTRNIKKKTGAPKSIFNSCVVSMTADSKHSMFLFASDFKLFIWITVLLQTLKSSSQIHVNTFLSQSQMSASEAVSSPKSQDYIYNLCQSYEQWLNNSLLISGAELTLWQGCGGCSFQSMKNQQVTWRQWGISTSEKSSGDGWWRFTSGFWCASNDGNLRRKFLISNPV